MKIVYVINHLSFLVSHRLNLLAAHIVRGNKVVVVSGCDRSRQMDDKAVEVLNRNGIYDCINVGFTADGVNLFRELVAIFKIYRILRREKADIVHCITPKAVVYAGLCARLLNVNALIITISGMGLLETTDRFIGPWFRLLQKFSRLMYRYIFLHQRKCIVVQNEDDMHNIISNYRVDSRDVKKIAGSGVNMDLYPVPDFAHKKKQVLFPARLLKEKGVYEFIGAARNLRAGFPDWQFLLAGDWDYPSPNAISAAQVREWNKEENIICLGYVSDIHKIFLDVWVVCLPSYREGLPKALLEAAAGGCAIITTDSIGCREAIVAGETGDLIMPKSEKALTEALQQLLSDQGRIESYARNGRALAEQKYYIKLVTAAMFEIYDQFPPPKSAGIRRLPK